MWRMMKVNGISEGSEGDVDGCCRVRFCFVIHCGHLRKDEY